jgi:hypothetical protein
MKKQPGYYNDILSLLKVDLIGLKKIKIINMKNFNISRFLIAVVVLLAELVSAQVAVRDTAIIWHTFNYELNEDNTINWSTDTEFDTVSKMFSGIILENKYLRVTLIPEFGGRIISMIYKPTGREELYQNPAGAPYGVGQDWFYYKWLMVYGGIFPTLSEPEHGKAWLLPWSYSFLKETPDTISIQMSWQDTVQFEGIDPNKWKYGVTNLRCDFTVTLIKGSSSLEADITLYNDSNDELNYEYWTCLTLAPGSEPGNPMCTYGTELIIPASKIKIPSWYPDIADQEQRISGEPGRYTFTKLRYWRNWTNDGIAYPWDDANENFWGVINHDNGEGFIRISDNKITPGIKIWAWGYEQSQNINPFENPAEVHRPYVELWAGNSNEFFVPAKITGNTVKQWKEIYIPTVGISKVTNANNEIIADLDVSEEKIINLKFMTTKPENNFNVVIEVTGQSPQILLEEMVVPDPVNGNLVIADLPGDQIWTTGDSLKFTITNLVNEYYLTASIPIDTTITGIANNQNVVQKFQLYQNYPNPFNPATTISYTLSKSGLTTLKVYDVLGKEVAILVDEYKTAGTYEVKFNVSELDLSSGLYFYTLNTSGYTQTLKMILIK